MSKDFTITELFVGVEKKVQESQYEPYTHKIDVRVVLDKNATLADVHERITKQLNRLLNKAIKDREESHNKEMKKRSTKYDD